MAAFEVPAATVTTPALILEVLLPAVVLNVIFAIAPLVLASKLIAPFWSMSLLEMKLILEPLTPVIVPI